MNGLNRGKRSLDSREIRTNNLASPVQAQFWCSTHPARVWKGRLFVSVWVAVFYRWIDCKGGYQEALRTCSEFGEYPAVATVLGLKHLGHVTMTKFAPRCWLPVGTCLPTTFELLEDE